MVLSIQPSIVIDSNIYHFFVVRKFIECLLCSKSRWWSLNSEGRKPVVVLLVGVLGLKRKRREMPKREEMNLSDIVCLPQGFLRQLLCSLFYVFSTWSQKWIWGCKPRAPAPTLSTGKGLCGESDRAAYRRRVLVNLYSWLLGHWYTHDSTCYIQGNWQ